MKIILARHAETEWNQRGVIQGQLDSPITLDGSRQVGMLISGLISSGFIPKHVISSPLNRARETALLISQAFSCNLLYKNELMEQNFGDLEGTSLQECYLRIPKMEYMFNNVEYIPPNGESLIEAAQRALKFVASCPQHFPRQNLLLISHGRIMQAIVAYLKEGTFDNFACYYHLNASYTVIDVSNKNMEIQKWGIGSHLLAKR